MRARGIQRADEAVYISFLRYSAFVSPSMKSHPLVSVAGGAVVEVAELHGVLSTTTARAAPVVFREKKKRNGGKRKDRTTKKQTKKVPNGHATAKVKKKKKN